MNLSKTQFIETFSEKLKWYWKARKSAKVNGPTSNQFGYLGMIIKWERLPYVLRIFISQKRKVDICDNC